MFLHHLITLFLTLSLSHSNPLELKGVLLERGTKKPLSNVNIYVLPHKLKETTDRNGKFHFKKVPEGDFSWVVNLTGYKKLEKYDSIYQKEQEDQEEERTLYLEQITYQGFETTIYGKNEKRDLSTRKLKSHEFSKLPGSGGDPVKAVQNLPGINRPSSFQSNVIIQGSAPKDTEYRIDHHPVPLIFHFGGLTSVVIPEAIDEVEYLSAGYGSENSRALGGVIGLHTRNPRSDRLHGIGFFDLYHAGALLEGPIGDRHSILIAARRSYIGQVLKAILKDNDDFNLTVAPTYSDLSILSKSKITPIDDLKMSFLASSDTLEFLLDEPVQQDPSFRGTFFRKTSYFRLIPQWTHKHSSKSISRWSFGLGRDWIRVNVGESFFYLRTIAFSTRLEFERQWNKNWNGIFGIDNSYNWARVELDLPAFFTNGGIANPVSSTENDRVNVDAENHAVGLYTTQKLQLGKSLTVKPGARLDYFPPTEEVLPSPRVEVSYQFTPYSTTYGAGGLYYQSPEPQEVSAEVGNPALQSPKAWHLKWGLTQDFRSGSSRGFDVSTGLFYRFFDRLVTRSSSFETRNGTLIPQRYNNSERGRALGWETQIKFQSFPWKAWVSYTLSKSDRWNPSNGTFLFQYDQTHHLNLIGSVELGRNWTLSTRFRYVTGNPVTPVSGGTFDADLDVYFPNRGPLYTERLNPFFQLDFRIDKKWVFDTWILSAYLDIQNITNRKNAEAVQYAYNYQSSETINGLPIIPSLGLKGEF